LELVSVYKYTQWLKCNGAQGNVVPPPTKNVYRRYPTLKFSKDAGER